MSRSLGFMKGMWVRRDPRSLMGLAMIVALVFGVLLLCSGISTAQTVPPPANTTYTIKDLGEPYLGFNGFNDVNDSGQVAGYASIRKGNGYRLYAFLYSDGQMQDLGTLGGTDSAAYGLNDSGQVVGWARLSTGDARAYLYSGGQMQDLNDLLPADSGWELLTARAINSSGQILGIGTLNGQHRAFLATPTQAPQVMSTVPAADATAVDPAANVTATFSEEMMASSINPTTFKLFRKNSTKKEVAASVHYEAATHTATLDPTDSLQRGASYNAVVSTGQRT